MNQNQSKNSANSECPQPAVLKEFLQGLLEPPSLQQCESHVADCPSCHETLRGLNVDDTLSQHVAGAIKAKQEIAQSESNQRSDSLQVENLVQRLLNPSTSRADRRRNGTADAELLADRAAEVLRYLEPVDDDWAAGHEPCLGKLDNYLLVQLLGAGSTGVVFHAIDQTLNRSVALKVLRPSLGTIARERFLAEAQVAASIEHSHVVTIYQVGSKDRLAYIAMQWLPGQTLEQRLLDSELDEQEIRQVITQIAAGLTAAHRKQLVHRDIKPANIWICDENSEVKILDFGLARIADDDPGLTATGMLAGTPNFMSPEQTRGLELDGRSDLFSLGCVLYRLLTGRLPFGAPTVLATLQSIQNEQPETPQSVRPEISAELSDLTMCLLEKQPNNRPESAVQLTQMLESRRTQWPRTVASYSSRPNPLPVSPAKESESHLPKTSALFSGRGLVALVGLSMLGFFGFWFAPQIVRIVSDQGEIVIDANDEDVSIRVTQDGNLVTVLDTSTQNSFNIRSGEYEIEAVGKNGSESDNGANSYEVSPNSFKMKRGQQTIVTVSKRSLSSPLTAVDLEQVLPAVNLENQVQADLQRVFPDNTPSATTKPAIYNGRTFEQWLDIASRDLDPKTAGSALLACARFANSSSDNGAILVLLRKLARLYGSNIYHGTQSEKDVVRDYLIKAFAALDPELSIEFLIGELKSGNEKSRKFCIWIVLLGTIYQNDPVMQEKRQRAIVRSGVDALDAVTSLDDDDQIKQQLLDGLKGSLSPTGKAYGISHLNLEEMTKINPELRQWIKQKYESCPANSTLKNQLASLLVAHFATDQNLYREQVRKLFDPETDSSLRDSLLQNIGGFDVDEEQHATLWLLLLENQFPHPQDKEHRQWLESVFTDLPKGYSTSNFAAANPVEFNAMHKLHYNGNGILTYRNDWEGTKTSLGKPALTRRLLNNLWRTEAELSPEYKKNVLVKFLNKWMIDNDIKTEFGQDKTKDLKIAEDIELLVEAVKQGKKRNEIIAMPNLSSFVRQTLGLNYQNGGVF